MRVYQDLVEQHGFTHATTRSNASSGDSGHPSPSASTCSRPSPERRRRLTLARGAPTRQANGKYSLPYLFVMRRKYSGKSFRKVVWKADQQSWARLHEEAFWAFGGSVQYVVLDNLEQGVVRPDLYDPAINSVYAAVLAHYGAVADAARVADPNRRWRMRSSTLSPRRSKAVSSNRSRNKTSGSRTGRSAGRCRAFMDAKSVRCLPVRRQTQQLRQSARHSQGSA
jgi:hypothetical protein